MGGWMSRIEKYENRVEHIGEPDAKKTGAGYLNRWAYRPFL